ncbi:hypothetical protein [Treponema phagedenis]|uniref:hypothetical protein n=1 Tax=Treponema phagedenis TaxID=162 RepID=UPI001FD18D98|nr:hypothetical protein [Treponema phagedenis]
MIKTPLSTEQKIRGNNRSYTARIIFSFLSCKVPESIKIFAPNTQTGSVPDQIVYPYLYHIEQRLFIDEEINYRVFPEPYNIHRDNRIHQVKRQPYSHIGYIGKKADHSGSVTDCIKLYLPNTDTKKITIRTNPDRIIKEATVIAKTKNDTEITRYTITNNTRNEIVFPLKAENVGILELHVTKHTANKRIWIVSFYPGFEFFVTEKDVVKIKQQKKKTENKEGSIGRLYINSLEIELNNITRMYDDKNSESPIAGFFNANAIVSVALILNTRKNQKPFILNFGNFFVTDIDTNEQKISVTVKAQDYIGVRKNDYLNLGIGDKTNAYECFAKIANAINLSAIKVDEQLKRVALNRIPLNGNIGSLLNKLCVLTNAFCACDETGSALIATPMLSRHGAIRYPLRYFLLHEYKSQGGGQTKTLSPNIINLSYATYEYDGEYHAGKKQSYIYNERIPKREFPQDKIRIPLHERELGAGAEPSATFTILLPDNFEALEFSDPLIPKALEYETIYEYGAQEKPIRAIVKVWNFIDRDEGEQFTIIQMIREKPYNTILKTENFIVPKMPRTYIIPEKDPSLNSADAEAVESRNAHNKPEVFKIDLKDAASFDLIKIENIFKQTQFEFLYRITNEGIEVKAWNYFKENPQTLTVKIYGSRLTPSQFKKTITARNEDDIQVNGEIVKNIEVGALASDDIARDVLQSMSYYYRHFAKDFSVQAWSDPRLMLYDLIAFKSLRGYGFMQGIIDEMEYTYNGALAQKIKIKQTKKHTRDSRALKSFALKDRPVLAKREAGYA